VAVEHLGTAIITGAVVAALAFFWYDSQKFASAQKADEEKRNEERERRRLSWREQNTRVRRFPAASPSATVVTPRTPTNPRTPVRTGVIGEQTPNQTVPTQSSAHLFDGDDDRPLGI
jgi:hypothetical protein